MVPQIIIQITNAQNDYKNQRFMLAHLRPDVPDLHNNLLWTTGATIKQIGTPQPLGLMGRTLDYWGVPWTNETGSKTIASPNPNNPKKLNRAFFAESQRNWESARNTVNARDLVLLAT